MDDFDARIAARFALQLPFEEGVHPLEVIRADYLAISQARGPAHSRAVWIEALERVRNYVVRGTTIEDRRERLNLGYQKLSRSDFYERTQFILP